MKTPKIVTVESEFANHITGRDELTDREAELVEAAFYGGFRSAVDNTHNWCLVSDTNGEFKKWNNELSKYYHEKAITMMEKLKRA